MSWEAKSMATEPGALPTEPGTGDRSADVLIIGSGAGGAITAATLAEAGLDVLIAEEGPCIDTAAIGVNTPHAMQTLYRNAGLSPILGRSSIAFVEGRCVGGSTEINSAFWHRPPAQAVDRWVREYRVHDLDEDSLAELLAEIEGVLRPTMTPEGGLPVSSQVFGRGLEALGLNATETPRLQRGDPTRSQFDPGSKASMSRTYLPRAIDAGARLLADCRIRRLLVQGGRVSGAEAVHAGRRIRLRAGSVFVCGGAIQTPALLRRSRIKRRVGDSLRIQPMLKVAASFDAVLDSHESVMPVYQMHDPSTGFFLGGSVFTPGFLGMSLSDSWPANEDAIARWRHMGIFYASCRGSASGRIRAFPGTGEAVVHYPISREDQMNLSMGMAKLCEALFAGGARAVHPGLRDCVVLRSPDDVRRLLTTSGHSGFSLGRMSISTVHVSSSCPMGENEALCPVDSFGRVRGFANLYLGDASIIPDAPGVNPQGTVMALALRNARHFLSEREAGRAIGPA
jgi:choline dehydrogenase-like flavoprotein